MRLALSHALPTVAEATTFAEAGGLLSYAPSDSAMVRERRGLRGQDLQGRQPLPSCRSSSRRSSSSSSTWRRRGRSALSCRGRSCSRGHAHRMNARRAAATGSKLSTWRPMRAAPVPGETRVRFRRRVGRRFSPSHRPSRRRLARSPSASSTWPRRARRRGSLAACPELRLRRGEHRRLRVGNAAGRPSASTRWPPSSSRRRSTSWSPRSRSLRCGAARDPADGDRRRRGQRSGRRVLATSLARPGWNATGLTVTFPEFFLKRLELVKELLPGLSRVALVFTPAELPAGGRPDRAFRGGGQGDGRSDRVAAGPRPGGDRRRRPARAPGPCPGQFHHRHELRARQTGAHRRCRFRGAGDPGDRRVHPLRCRRAPDGVRRRSQRSPAPRRHLCRQDTQGCTARRTAGRAADQVRVHRQPQGRARRWASRFRRRSCCAPTG